MKNILHKSFFLFLFVLTTQRANFFNTKFSKMRKNWYDIMTPIKEPFIVILTLYEMNHQDGWLKPVRILLSYSARLNEPDLAHLKGTKLLLRE